MGTERVPSDSDEGEGGKFQSWIGKQETVDDTLSAFPTAALAALLDRGDLNPQPGQALPPLAHWLHFLPTHRQSELAENGHVRRGELMPPVREPRRMFAGARITFNRPLRIGDRARRVGTVTNVVAKQGRSGSLTFVSLRQEIAGPQGFALVEEQDIVYRTASANPDRAAEPPPPPASEHWGRDVVPDITMLFRYSALIFNAHRIHYDRLYATETEQYPGLIVHGQLIATFLADLARTETGRDFESFSFRSLAPFFADDPIRLSGRREGNAVQLWASQSGNVGTVAQATLRPGI